MAFSVKQPLPSAAIWGDEAVSRARNAAFIDRGGKVAQSGIALVIVLWVLTLLSVIAGGLAYEMRIETALADNLTGHAQAGALAEAGINYAIMRLLDQDPNQPLPADGSVQEWPFAGGMVRIAVYDEGGKIDLNGASRELLAGLLVSAGGLSQDEAAAMADRIIDWRDADELRSLEGAEQGDYAAAGLSYGPANKPFDNVDELRLVLGMTPDLYARISPALTTYSGRSTVTPDVAPAIVLQAIPGVDPAQVEAYLQARADSYANNVPLPPPPTVAGPYFANSTGLAYTVQAVAAVPRGAVAAVEATVALRRGGDAPYILLAWREGLTGESGAQQEATQ